MTATSEGYVPETSLVSGSPGRAGVLRGTEISGIVEPRAGDLDSIARPAPRPGDPVGPRRGPLPSPHEGGLAVQQRAAGELWRTQ
jgi:hypothetical protein